MKNTFGVFNQKAYLCSMKIQHLIDAMDATVHPEYQEEYDNAGFLVGNPANEITGVLVALDLTEEVVEEAVEKGLNVIVTHHPFIFGGVRRITPGNTVGRLIMQLISNKIAVYSAHTNLDNMLDGVNGILSQQLQLTDCHILKTLEGHDDVGAGLVGMLPSPMPLFDFIEQVKRTLQLPALRTNVHPENIRSNVRRVAICGGAGSFLINDAIRAKADIFLTGDLKYHDYQKAEGRLVLGDICHYESERFCKELLANTVKQIADNEFEVHLTQRSDRWEQWC